MPAVRRRPRAPLAAVDRAELAVLVGPLVPDRDAALLEPADVRVAAHEPQELAHDRMEVHLLRRHEREPAAQVEPHLVAEHAQRAGARPVVLAGSLVEYPLKEIEVRAHTAKVTADSARPRADGLLGIPGGTSLRSQVRCGGEADAFKDLPRPKAGIPGGTSLRSQGRCGGEADAFRDLPGRRPGSPAADSATAESALRDKPRTGPPYCRPRRCRSRRRPAPCRDRASSACRRRARRSSLPLCRGADPAP